MAMVLQLYKFVAPEFLLDLLPQDEICAPKVHTQSRKIKQYEKCTRGSKR